MKSKYDEILEAVIRTFLQTREPIGSAKLKEHLPFPIAPATIRYYFNKMVERGQLCQMHKSSGRIPSEETLKQYWRKHLKELELIVIAMDELVRISEEEGLFMLVKPIRHNRLIGVERVGRRYLILAFETDEYIIRFHPQLESFLSDLIGYDLEDVKRIARDIGMMTLYYKMRAKNDEEIMAFNPEAIIKIAGDQSSWGRHHMRQFLDGDVVETVDQGLHFDPLVPRGYMVLKTEATIDDQPIKLLCIGAIDHDFTKIFKEV